MPRFARQIVKPISPEEFAAQAERMAAQEAEARRAQAEAEATFMASYEAITPADPFAALTQRVGALEDQVQALRDIIKGQNP